MNDSTRRGTEIHCQIEEHLRSQQATAELEEWYRRRSPTWPEFQTLIDRARFPEKDPRVTRQAAMSNNFGYPPKRR